MSGPQARVLVRVQGASLLEAFPDLDADGDGRLDAAEVAARQDDLQRYVAEHYELRVGTARDLSGGSPLVSEPVRVAFDDGETFEDASFPLGRIDVERLYRSDRAILDLAVRSTLFAATSPDHVDLCRIEWLDDPAAPQSLFALDSTSPVGRCDPHGRGAFAAFTRLGIEHILSGTDHIAFVLALLLAAGSLRAVLGVVTAFTLAHSTSLALSALGVIDTSRYSRVVEAAIALSIAYVAVDQLLFHRAPRTRWPEAFGFGLIHGLGFASVLQQSLLAERSRAWALFSFNLGVEVGQVLVVALALAALRLLRGAWGDPAPFLAPRPVRLGGTAVIAALGFWWFFQRLA